MKKRRQNHFYVKKMEGVCSMSVKHLNDQAHSSFSFCFFFFVSKARDNTLNFFLVTTH